MRVDSDLKIKAETILKQLGISMSGAFNMFLTQVVINNGLPFDVRLPAKPVATSDMSEEEVNKLVQEGIDSCKQRTYTQEEVDEMLKKI